ncbi:acyltransferase [Hymenobacter ruber]
MPYFQPLDIVRFVAALLILITHSYEHWTDVPQVAATMVDWGGQPAWWATKLKLFVGSFNIGVDIFFLMSGFLITYLLLAEKQRYARIDIKSFYMRRVLRIWPLYYFCVAMAPVLSHFAGEPAANMPAHLLFLGNFDLMKHGWGSTAVNHLWSICIEEHFYLVWPLLIAFVPRHKLTTVFGAVILLSFLTRLYYFYFVPDSYMALYLNTLCRWDALAIGALFAYAYFYGYQLPRVPAALRWMLYGATLLVFASDSYGNWDNVFLLSFKKYVFLGVIAFFIGNVLFNPDSAVKWRGRTIFHYFGKISYGIYMFHGFVIFAFVRVFPMFHTPLFILWVMLGTLLVAAASYELVEKPILRLKKYFDAFRQQRMQVAQPVPVAIAEPVSVPG